MEMMVAMLAGIVLALTASTMLVFSFSAWSTHTKSIKMQNDASLAMLVIGREIRESNLDDITYEGNGLAFATNAVRSNVTSIVMSGNQLVFQPSGLVLVEDWLNTFSAQATGSYVNISLSLLNDGSQDSITLDASFFPRN